METIVNEFNSLIINLRSENQSLRMQSAKDEILAKSRLESLQSVQASLDETILKLASIMKERDDAFCVIENNFAELIESRHKMKHVLALEKELKQEPTVLATPIAT